MNEPSGWWTGQRIGRWAVGLAQDVRQAMRVLVKWPAFTGSAAGCVFGGAICFHAASRKTSWTTKCATTSTCKAMRARAAAASVAP